MNQLQNYSKMLKRCLKRKGKVTLATVVIFLITGMIGYGGEVEYDVEILKSDTYGTADYYLKNFSNLIEENEDGSHSVKGKIKIVGTSSGASGSQAISSKGDTIINEGEIDVVTGISGTDVIGYAQGMGTHYNVQNSVVKNNGTINVQGKNIWQTSGMGVNPEGTAINLKDGLITVANGSGMIDYSGNKNKKILNQGIINVEDEGVGIFYRKETLGKGNVKNEGTINVTGDNGIGLFIHMDKEDESYNNKSIVNSGTILVTGENSYAVSGSVGSDTLYLEKGSHIVGKIDLDSPFEDSLETARDIIDINGVGTEEKAEKIDVENVEHIKINNSNIDLYGNMLVSSTAIDVKSNDGNSKLTINGNISAMENTENVYVINAQSNNTTIEITEKGVVTSVKGGSGIVLGGKNSVGINNGLIKVTNGLSDEREWNSKGVNIIGDAKFFNKGTIEVTKDSYGGVALWGYAGEVVNDTDGKINLYGDKSMGIFGFTRSGQSFVSLEETGLKIENKGLIIGENLNEAKGMRLYQKIDQNKNNVDSYLENNGQIKLSGDRNIGIEVKKIDGEVNLLGKNTSTGIIEIDGTNSLGMYASNARVLNDGAIKLNIFSDKTENGYSGNAAMHGENGAVIINTGSIYLTDVDVSEIDEEEYDKFKSYIKTDLIKGEKGLTYNFGTVRNKNGKIIVSNGIELEDVLKEFELNENGEYVITDEMEEKINLAIKNETTENLIKPIILDKTVNFLGENLSLNLVASERLEDNKYLVKVENNPNLVNISGNLEGEDLGLSISNSTINLNGSTIKVNELENSRGTAIDMKNSKLTSNEAIIKGDIKLTKSEIDLKDSTVVGDIYLEDSHLVMDNESANNYKGEIFGSPTTETLEMATSENSTNIGGTKVTLGTAGNGNHTNFSGNLTNIAELNLKGIVVIENEANISVNKINVEKDQLFVIRVDENGEHGLEDVGSIDVTKDGHFMIETNNLEANDKIDLEITLTLGDSDRLYASQYIYDIKLEGATEKGGASSLDTSTSVTTGTTLVVTYADASTVTGLEEVDYDIYNSLVESGKIGDLNSTSIDAGVSSLISLFDQTQEKNSYALSTKIARDNINSWKNTLTKMDSNYSVGELEVTGMAIGKYDNMSKSEDINNYLTGLMVAGTYGLPNNVSLGIALGGGYTNGEFDSSNKVAGDSFYVGLLGSKKISNYELKGTLGYQLGRLDVKRNISNDVDNLSFGKDLDINAINFNLVGTKKIDLMNGFQLEPSVELNMVYVEQDKAHEGNEAMALNVKKHETTTYEGKIGIDLSNNITENISVYTGIEYAYLGGDTDKNLTANFGEGTTDFDLQAIDLGENTGEVTVGMDISLDKGLGVVGEYAYKFGDNEESSKVTLGVEYKF